MNSTHFSSFKHDNDCFKSNKPGKKRTRKKRRSKFDLCNVYKNSDSRPLFAYQPGESKFYKDALSKTLAPDPTLNLKPQQLRTTFSHEQMIILEAAYQKNTKPCTTQKEMVAMLCGLSFEKVRVWYQNRRAKEKRVQEDELAFLAEKICLSKKNNSYNHLRNIERKIEKIFDDGQDESEETFIKQLLRQKDINKPNESQSRSHLSTSVSSNHSSSNQIDLTTNEESYFKQALRQQSRGENQLKAYQKEICEEEKMINHLLQDNDKTVSRISSTERCRNNAYSTVRSKSHTEPKHSFSYNYKESSNEEDLIKRLLKIKSSKKSQYRKERETSEQSDVKKIRVVGSDYRSGKNSRCKESRPRSRSKNYHSKKSERRNTQPASHVNTSSSHRYDSPHNITDTSTIENTNPVEIDLNFNPPIQPYTPLLQNPQSTQHLLLNQNNQAASMLMMYQQLAAFGIPLTPEQLAVMDHVNQQMFVGNYQQMMLNSQPPTTLQSVDEGYSNVFQNHQPRVPTYGGTVNRKSWYQPSCQLNDGNLSNTYSVINGNSEYETGYIKEEST